jgi:hypothetical protein
VVAGPNVQPILSARWFAGSCSQAGGVPLRKVAKATAEKRLSAACAARQAMARRTSVLRVDRSCGVAEAAASQTAVDISIVGCRIRRA